MEKNRNNEALELSEEILKNIELSEIPLANILLKVLRLARLANNFEATEWLMQEINGFDSEKGFLTAKAWVATGKSGRRYFKKDKDEWKEYANTQSVAVMESTIKSNMSRMEVSVDPDISVSSHSVYNPVIPLGNAQERLKIATEISNLTGTIEKVRSKVYQYVLSVNHELKFGNLTEDIFTRKRASVDKLLADMCPDTISKFISVYENLLSGNNEDWANAVHSCRRILKDVADKLYPPSDTPIEKEGGKTVKVGNDQYVNRLMIYIESNSKSEKYNSVVGSHLKYIGERIDSITEAVNKGSHHEVSLDEAERYILYTYIIIGDILSIKGDLV